MRNAVRTCGASGRRPKRLLRWQVYTPRAMLAAAQSVDSSDSNTSLSAADVPLHVELRCVQTLRVHGRAMETPVLWQPLMLSGHNLLSRVVLRRLAWLADARSASTTRPHMHSVHVQADWWLQGWASTCRYLQSSPRRAVCVQLQIWLLCQDNCMRCARQQAQVCSDDHTGKLLHAHAPASMQRSDCALEGNWL